MQSQRNSVPRRFGFGFAPTASNSASTSNHNTSSSSSTSNAVDTTPDSNRRHSTGKPAINAQSPVKGSPSPNRNSLKMSKGEPATPTSVSSPVTKPATTSIQSPPSTTELSNSSVVSIGGSSSAGSTFSVEQSLIKVCVRVRPLLNEEITESVVWQWKENSITPIPWHQRNQGGSNGAMEYSMANPNATFTFDHLFTPDHTNTHIFQDVIKEIVTSGMNGYHGSVFTYGQTSSGKTFTMYGAPSQQGVITQAIEYCFDAINTFPEREFLLRVSYLEVYNEQVKDLLSTESIPIKILYDPKVGTVLSGVKEHVVFNPQQVYQLIKQGESHRHIGVTDMNAQSSRAHTLFKIIIESKERNSLKASPVRVSTLNLVDLAGSENAKMTNSTGERAREAKHINQSLLTLSTIIQRLSEEHAHHRKSSAQHLPYRDSKLTRLLESALDGNARIAIICNISPTSRCMEESVNTLKFGARAKLIRLSAKVNENVDDKTLLRAYREEIEQLKLRLKELEEKQSLPAPVAPVSSTMMTPPLQRSRDRSQSNDDNQSIEVTSATKIDIHETIHQIEDKLMQTSHIAKEDDEQQKMLQMIEAMERLILKADNSSKQKIRRNLGAPSSETVDPSERLIRSKSFKSGDNDQGNEGKELESKKSFKKLPSFATGIPINTSHRSNIPRRGANQNPSTSLSRSNSSVSIDNSGSIAVDKVGSNESDLFATKSKVFSPKGLPKKKSFNVPAQSSPKQPQQQSMFLSHSNSSRDVGDDGGAPISSKSFEEAILRSEGNRQNDEERETGDNEGEEDDGEHKFSPLTRQPSIPLSDLQQNYNKLEVNAGKVGLMPTLHLASHHWNTYAYSMPPPVPASDKDHPGTAIDRTASISPLTVGTEPSASVLPQQAPTRGQRSLPPLDTNVSNIGGFAFSPSTTVNHGNLPPHQPQSSPYETHFLSTSIPTGGTTPMKNRILRKVKYSDDDFVATPGVVGVASISGDTPLPDDNSATALEKMRQFAMSNDTLDSLNNSIDARFVAPNDVLVEDDSVLLGVSKMLMMLKDYISKAKQQERPQPLISNESNSSNKPSVSIGIAAVSDNNSVSGKESIQSKNSEQSQAGNNNNSTTKTTNNTSNSDNKPLPAPSAPVVPGNASHGGNQRKRELGPNEIAVCRDEYEKLKQDFALKEADNHFLQEELEQKDKMLGMLTEGLKEVQESQLQWLTANQDLSQELEKTLLMNQILRNEITRLNNLLLSQQSQVTSTEKDEEGNSSLQRKSPLPPTTTTTFVSEEVTQLLLSPSRAVSTNQNLYLTRSRSVSQSRSPMRSYQSQGQLPQISSPPPLLQSDVSTPFVDRERTPPSSPTPKQDVEAKVETNIPETPLVELVRSPSPLSPLPLTDNQEVQKEESQKTDDASIVIPLSAPVIMSPLPNIAASPPKSPKPSSIPAEGLLTPEPSNSVFVSPMSVSSTATTTIASPDSNVWTALNPSQVHIPSSANNVLDWKQLPMDFTNIHNEAELTEYFGENEEKEKKNGELKVENSVGTPLQTPLGEQIISPGELSNLTNSHCSLDHEDASVIVHVERIYHSCDSMESFGSIKESW